MPHSRDDEVKKLILDYQNGEQRAFSRLMDKYGYWRYIYKSLCARGIPSPEAEDYTQQICTRLIHGLKEFRFACSFEGYLNIIIKRQVINYRIKKRRTKPHVSIFEQILTGDDQEIRLDIIENKNASLPDAELKVNELRLTIKSCLNSFINKTAKLIVCSWLYGLKQRQIAGLLRISFSTVGNHLHRGKQRLRYCLRKGAYAKATA